MKRNPLCLPLIAALMLSAAAHAAVAILADGGAPISVATASAAAPGDRTPLRASLVSIRSSPPVATIPPAAVAAVAAPSPTGPRSALERSKTFVASAASAAPARAAKAPDARPPVPSVEATALEPRADDGVAEQSPTPLTYPVISLPSDDDPHRIGFVRLLLVVSSEGRVAQTVVADATLSEGYVERIAHSFDAVRFKPASAHGFPRPGWYEVVVRLEFDPEARSAI